MPETIASTVDGHVDAPERRCAPPAPHLFRVLDADRPLASSARHSLAGIEHVVLGRGAAVRRSVDAGAPTLELAIPDPRVSTRHATLRPSLGRWILEDAGSRNGTVVNGREVRQAVLNDGDLVELGHTFFLFRTALAPGEADLDSDALTPAAPGLATLVPSLAADFAQLAQVARSAVSVIVLGETGTGKELVAHAIHALSSRAGPIVAVNCGALPPNLVESELFGYRKGAFSGATEDRLGLLRAADRGTLFLDEIGDLPLASQAAFLRVLQEKQVTPVGATRPIAIDVRVVSATHRALDVLAVQGQFRADLLARLSGYTVRLPPLRRRREDLGLLVAALLRRLAPEAAARVSFTKEAARALLRHEWPLNVRELEKVLGAAVVLADGDAILPEHLFESQRADPAAPVPAPTVAGAPAASAPLGPEDERRRAQMIALLEEHGGNISALARVMDRDRVQIRRWLQRYGLDPEAYRRR